MKLNPLKSLLSRASRKILRSRQIVGLFFVGVTVLGAGAHDHYGAGFLDTNGNGVADAGEPLRLVGATGTTKLFHLLARPVGQRPVQRCGGYYMLDERPRTLFPGDAFSFTALSDGQYDASTVGHAHTGSWIWMEITSVSGPVGAHFGYWESNWSATHDTPAKSFATNQPTSGPSIDDNKFVLSEGVDDVSEDPFGHIHGRAWTADKPGDYYIGFTLYDLSTSGPNGGPWHAPSQTYIYHFQAGPSFQPAIQRVPNTGNVLTWPSLMGYWTTDLSQTGVVFSIERSTTLTNPVWQSIGTVTGTTGATATFTDSAPPADKVFYRLNYLWATP
ncbi:MAG: hypothetical protein NTX04_06500 [Verrucomicrobia bacterium]|nr:hypothetical protein [Verrucomicrobiota bacterium]